ncbi:hypothetical protein [Halobacteriovorax sp. ZH5_bin.2]|uniref:hypothetical protein n=1 Tax=unclassified Halobacteriovorax TaxID=2639665 RepID=UPI0037135D68
MLKLTILSLLVIAFSSCNQKTLAPDFLTAQSTNTPPSTEDPPDPPDPPPPPPTPSIPPEIILTSSINYKPNIITGESYLVNEQATYTIPSILTASVGNAGQGWLLLDIDNIRYCYMGASEKKNKISLTYNLVHSTTDLINSCSSSLDTNLAPNLAIEIFNGDNLTFKLEDGICGNKCLDTEVTIILNPIL